MKKILTLSMIFLVFVLIGCAKFNPDERNNSNIEDIDLSAVLEVDSGQYSMELDLNHKNLISDKPQYFSDANRPKKIFLTLNNADRNLTYKDSLYYPLGNKTVHRYIVDGNENATILVDEYGNIDSILYNYTKLNINQTVSPEVVLEALKAELSKTINISYYKNVKNLSDNQNTSGFGIYDYLFYNKCDEYIIDYLRVSVSDDGNVFGLSINNLPVDDFKLNVDKDKENAVIEMKLKDIYNTDVTQYKSCFRRFDPCVVWYNNQIYVQYFIVAKYFHTQHGEMNSWINSILIPLSEISN